MAAGKVRFDYVHERNIGSVKKLLQMTLPVEYPDAFYDALVKSPQDLTQLVFYNEVLVGVVGCKVTLIDEESGPSGPKQVYIAAMAVLPAYRDLGIGTKAIEQVLSNVKDHSEINRVFLHVQEGNDEAVRFYERAGFAVEGDVEGYFPALTPSNAKLMSLQVEH